MGVITRFVDIVNSNVNAALDKAEKPEQLLRLVIQEMEEALVEVRSHAAKYIAEKKVIERKVESQTKLSADWQAKAELALAKDREDLARQALVAKNECESEIAAQQQDLDALSQALEKISEDATSLQNKLAEAKQKQRSIVNRQNAAVIQLKTRRQFDEAKMAAVSDKYERLHQKVSDLESQVEAYDLTQPVTLVDEFRQLESESKVEEELAELKKKVANA